MSVITLIYKYWYNLNQYVGALMHAGWSFHAYIYHSYNFWISQFFVGVFLYYITHPIRVEAIFKFGYNLEINEQSVKWWYSWLHKARESNKYLILHIIKNIYLQKFNERLECPMIWKSFRAGKPKSLNRITRIDYTCDINKYLILHIIKNIYLQKFNITSNGKCL
jgi:hypothetical protein